MTDGLTSLHGLRYLSSVAKNPDPFALARWLKDQRDARSLTQAHAAETVGVSRQTWAAWERGQQPTLVHLYFIADWAETTADEMRPVVMRAFQ